MLVIAAILCNIAAWFEDQYPELALYQKTNDKGEIHWMLFGVRVEDMLNPVAWWDFIIGEIRYLVLNPHILEQILLRQQLCEDCVIFGSCLDCGCKMPHKTMAFGAECSLGRWGKIDKDPKVWAKRKKDYGITIKFLIGHGQNL